MSSFICFVIYRYNAYSSINKAGYVFNTFKSVWTAMMFSYKNFDSKRLNSVPSPMSGTCNTDAMTKPQDAGLH